MRSSSASTAAALAVFFAVADSFLLLPLQHRDRGGVVRSNDHEFIVLPSIIERQEGKKKTTTTSSYDPADAVASESSSDLTTNVLKETNSYATGEEQNASPQSSFAQVSNICRDLDGSPLSPDYFGQTMGITNVNSYTCPEQETFRGFMSNGGRVHLFPGGETAFYKRIVFEDLPHAHEKLQTAPFKLVRDIQSYEVVAAFLKSKACQLLRDQTGVCIPKCYHAQSEPNLSNPMESKFSFLLQDFAPTDGWYQQWLLDDLQEIQATLTTYAKIHAFFWNGSAFWKEQTEAAKELEAGVWKSGSYVQPQAQNANQCQIVAQEWAKKRMRFENELSSFDYWDNLGERLESIAEECGRLAHPFAEEGVLSEQYKKYRTFTHGDPKQANL